MAAAAERVKLVATMAVLENAIIGSLRLIQHSVLVCVAVDGSRCNPGRTNSTCTGSCIAIRGWRNAVVTAAAAVVWILVRLDTHPAAYCVKANALSTRTTVALGAGRAAHSAVQRIVVRVRAEKLIGGDACLLGQERTPSVLDSRVGGSPTTEPSWCRYIRIATPRTLGSRVFRPAS